MGIAEPVFFLALVEGELEAADADGDEPRPMKSTLRCLAASLRALRCGGSSTMRLRDRARAGRWGC
jgi:hypothetical protein